MTISDLPTPPARSDPPATFVTRADAFVAALPTLVSEMNAEIAAINGAAAAAAQGFPVEIPLTFDTTTTDSDPGAGKLRLNNATQTSATAMYIDLTSAAAGNPDITALLDWMDDSTSTSSKGVIRLYLTADPTVYLVFNLTAWTTASGYRKLTVAHLFASGTSPVLSNSAAITLAFFRTGDAGDLSGGITLTDADITGIRLATHNGEVAIATTSGTINIDWTAGQLYAQAEPTGNITYTMTAPSAPCNLLLRIISDGSSPAVTFTWPATVKWLGFQWAAAANKGALISLYFDGTNYRTQGANDV